MRFEDALGFMRNGKLARRECWQDNNGALSLRPDGRLVMVGLGYDEAIYVDAPMLVADDWVVFDSNVKERDSYHLPESLKKFESSNTPPVSRLEARIAYLERLHDVVHRDGPIEKPSYRQIMKHVGDLWRDEA